VTVGGNELFQDSSFKKKGMVALDGDCSRFFVCVVFNAMQPRRHTGSRQTMSEFQFSVSVSYNEGNSSHTTTSW
jgi:hypothetical protein